MEIVANIILVATSFAAAFYCRDLSTRIRKLKDLDHGLGGAIAALSGQVTGMQAALNATKKVSGAAADSLLEMTARAEIAAGRLEILLANVHENTERFGIAGAPAAKPVRTEPPLQLKWQNRIRPVIPLGNTDDRVSAPNQIAPGAADSSEIVRALKQALLRQKIPGGAIE